MTEIPLTLTADDPASRALAAADPLLGALIARTARVELPPPPSRFESLVGSIVAQQLADRVARTIWGRVVEVAEPTPQAFAAASSDALRSAGLSTRKAEYVQGVAHAVLTGEVDLEHLDSLSDEEVIEQLVALRGVGRWTAEMFLIFALRRPDVLALDDMGVRISTGRVLGLGRAATREEVARRGELWRPHRTSASLWLWADGGQS